MVTILTTDGTHADLPAGGLVEVRSPDGDVLGQYKLATPDPLEVELGGSPEQLDRERADPSTVWYTAGQVADQMRGWRCSR